MKNKIGSIPSLQILLSANPDKISAPSLRLALENQKKAQEEAESQKALAFFNSANALLEQSVEKVRAIRKQKDEALVKVKKIHSAIEAFSVDGDCASLGKVIQEIRGY